MKISIKELTEKLLKQITHTTIEQSWSGSINCIEIGDLKIQFGIKNCIYHQYETITFKKPFRSSGYFACASYTSDGQVAVDNSIASITNQHADYCQIYSGGGRFAWLCIGY